MTSTRIFRLPDFGLGLVEGEIIRWFISVGDFVEEDQPIVYVEGDTVAVELPSPVKGRVTKTWGRPGDTIRVGAPLVAFEVAGGGKGSAAEELRDAQLSDRIESVAGVLEVDFKAVVPSGPQGEVLVADVHRAARALAARRKCLTVATEWFSAHGGLSTFNRELCQALARAGHSVVCVVPRASSKEVKDAEETGVTLLVVSRVVGLEHRASLLRCPKLPVGFIPEVVVGHDRITGSIADALARDFFPGALRVLLIHTAPGEIERFKDRVGRARRAAKREDVQARIATAADVVLAVGPRLYREFQTVLSGLEKPPPILRIDPGFPTWPVQRRPDQVSEQPRCLILGRVDDLELKGLDIAARAMALLPERRMYPEPVLVVRGARPRTEDAMEERLVGIGGNLRHRIRVSRYAAEIETLQQDLRKASLLLMPSRGEGFGLVGVEAITAGVPVLISAQSGLGELLLEVLGNDADRIVVPVSEDREKDAKTWAAMIDGVLSDRIGAFERARDLRRRLERELSWKKAVRQFEVSVAATEGRARG